MDPFRKVVKTEEEKRALIEQARVEWDALGAASDLVARDQESFLSKIADSIVVEREAFTPARELTRAERDRMDSDLLFERMYGDRITKPTGIAALDDLARANQEESLRKLLGPARREKTWLEELVREAINKVQSVPGREKRGVLSFEERLLSWRSEGDDSDAVKFLRARVAGDSATMRQIARSLATA